MSEGHDVQLPSERAQRRAAVVRWVLIAGFAALAAAGVVIGFGLGEQPGAGTGRGTFHCPMHPQIVADEPGTCPICGMDLVPIPASGTATTGAAPPWVCERHPEIRSDIPGRCPVDGTPLVRAGVEGRLEVQIDPARVREIGVVSVAVEEREIATEIRAPAQVSVDESRVAVVDTRLPGWISKLRVRTTGERVRAGQPLATLTSTDLYEAEAQLVAARQTAAAMGGNPAGETLIAQARGRLAALGVPAGEIARVASGGAAATQLAIRAPRAGTIVALGASEGAFVAPGTRIFTIADLSRVWVLADLSERDAQRIASGETATIESPGAPAPITARVELIEPLVDPTTRTRRVRLLVENETTLVPGASAIARFSARPRTAVVVPRDAVLTSEDESHVFVDLGEGRFTPRAVTLGEDIDGGLVEVTRGLARGTRIASTAAFMIDAESQLRFGTTASTGGAR